MKASAEISWSNHTRSMQETLTADRSEFDVMLDHFCRRVAGGLVPVANISDLCQSLVLADATETSLRTGEAIRV